MSGTFQVEDLKSFTPMQHILQIGNELKTVDFQTDERFEVQSSNVKNILTNALSVEDCRDLQKLPEIPDASMRLMYNDMAQNMLEKKMLEMRGRKFDVDYDDVPTHDNGF